MNRNRMFNHSDWQPTANGVWEAQATPADLDGCPPFEATCRAVPTGDNTWRWSLYQPINDSPHSALDLVADGHAATLAEAQRLADHRARLWRDQPADMALLASLAHYSDYSVVTCDRCGAAHRLGELLISDRCQAELPQSSCCDSNRFDGLTLDELAEAVTL